MTNEYRDIYKKILNDIFQIKKNKNPSYSLRSFARTLETSPTTLSTILSGKRPLPVDRGLRWAAILQLEGETKKQFLEALSKDSYYRLNPTERENRKLQKELLYHQLKLDSFTMISKWYHLGILNLTMLENFQSDDQWIANELDITIEECKEAIKRLIRLELLKQENNQYIRTHKSLETPTDIPSNSLKNFHRENINRALNALDNQSIEDRDITSIMMPINKSKLPEAKLKIKNFRRTLSKFLASDDGDQVYSLNIQLFPQNKGEII